MVVGHGGPLTWLGAAEGLAEVAATRAKNPNIQIERAVNIAGKASAAKPNVPVVTPPAEAVTPNPSIGAEPTARASATEEPEIELIEPTLRKNASGESAASQEAINRSGSQKAAGVKIWRVQRATGKRIPVIVDAADAKAYPGEDLIQEQPGKPNIILDSR